MQPRSGSIFKSAGTQVIVIRTASVVEIPLSDAIIPHEAARKIGVQSTATKRLKALCSMKAF